MNFEKPQEVIDKKVGVMSPEENERNEKFVKAYDLYKTARDYRELDNQVRSLAIPKNAHEKNLDVGYTFHHEAGRVADEFMKKFIEAEKEFVAYLSTISKKDVDLKQFSIDGDNNIFFPKNPLSNIEIRQKIQEVIE